MEASAAITGDVDKTQIPPLNQKRILAFVNHFLISTCNFLNEFSMGCETKFVQMERHLQKIEASLVILETKLASIPSDNDNNNETTSTTTPKKEEGELNSSVEEATDETENDEEDSSALNEAAPPVGVRACEDTRYRKFFKMLQVGVPAPAVKQKMQTEGLEPQILDQPNLLLADGMRD
ncbi:WASH complex subunit 3 [Drosophila tropicalis]|uniref:WASH complex subunit 3 n=1 Tax=Drosophila tropicalis TaxID=46794 RepID=UPI0035AB91CB